MIKVSLGKKILYSEKISELYDNLKNEFNLNEADTVLVSKDIVYQKY